jgi:chromosome segregation ATPase
MLLFISVSLLLLAVSFLLFSRITGSEKFLSAFAIPGAGKNTKHPSVFFAATPANASGSTGRMQDKTDELSMEIDDLEWLLEKKKTELEEIRLEKKLAESAAAQIDIIEDAIDAIETKLIQCQKQIASMKTLAYDLDELEVSYQQIKNEVAQSQHNYQVSLSENESLREQLELATEELTKSRMVRQQLQKKISLLEGINQDLESTILAMKVKS